MFLQNGCTWSKVVVFGQMLLNSGNVVVFEQKWLYSNKTGCIWAKWLYSGNVVVFGQKCL